MAAGNTYEAIATQTVTGSAAASVTFSSIPSTYTDLVVVVQGLLTTGADNVCLQFNGDTGSNYSVTVLLGDGTSASSFRTSNTSNCGRDVISNIQGNVIYNINNYSNATTYKTVLGRSSATNYGARTSVSMWRNTAAINQIVLFPTAYTFNVGTVLSIYGIKAA
jgi:hypothetical protein